MHKAPWTGWLVGSHRLYCSIYCSPVARVHYNDNIRYINMWNDPSVDDAIGSEHDVMISSYTSAVISLHLNPAIGCGGDNLIPPPHPHDRNTDDQSIQARSKIQPIAAQFAPCSHSNQWRCCCSKLGPDDNSIDRWYPMHHRSILVVHLVLQR